MNRCYEYKSIEIDNTEGFLKGFKNYPAPDFGGILSEEGKSGWRLVQVVTPTYAVSSNGYAKYVAVLEREYFGE